MFIYLIGRLKISKLLPHLESVKALTRQGSLAEYQLLTLAAEHRGYLWQPGSTPRQGLEVPNGHRHHGELAASSLGPKVPTGPKVPIIYVSEPVTCYASEPCRSRTKGSRPAARPSSRSKVVLRVTGVWRLL